MVKAKRALSIDPTYSNGLYVLADFMRCSGRFDEAIDLVAGQCD